MIAVKGPGEREDHRLQRTKELAIDLPLDG
jgi:hypothetical protein